MSDDDDAHYATNVGHEAVYDVHRDRDDDDVDDDPNEDEDGETCCPICLDPMSHADALHPVACSTEECTYNFCLNCLSALLSSSRDDYAIASDGSRHVKVKLACPNCRSDISGTVGDTMARRRTALAEGLRDVPDGELSAGELRRKHQCHDLVGEGGRSRRTTPPLEVDPTLFGGLDFAMSEQEQRYVTELMTSGYPDKLCQAATILNGIAGLLRDGRAVVAPPPSSAAAGGGDGNGGAVAPSSRGGGGGAAAEAGRAAAALNNGHQGVRPVDMRHGYSNAGIRTNRSSEGEKRETHVTNFQRQMEERARERLRRPLPARMPLCVALRTAEFEGLALKIREEGEAAHAAAAAVADQRHRPPPPPPSHRSSSSSSSSSWGGWLGRGISKSLQYAHVVAGGYGGGARAATTMTFVDDEWDGTVADAFARARIGRGEDGASRRGRQAPAVARDRAGPRDGAVREGVERILAVAAAAPPPQSIGHRRRGRVLVGSVRGQAGKSGMMKGDVVTHVNGEAFGGDASMLNSLLARTYEEHGDDGVVMMVVNAEECTAEALRLRSRVR